MRATGVLALVLLLGPVTHVRAEKAAVRPEVRVKTARITGNEQASGAFQRQVAASRPALLSCYQKDLGSHPGEVGLLALTVQIQPTGEVSKVTVVGSAVNAALQECALKTVRRLKMSDWKAPRRVFATLELVFQLSAEPHPQAMIKGGIPERLVAGTVEARLPGLSAACVKEHTLKGSPRLRMITDYDGTVQTAGVLGRVPWLAVRRCLVARVKLWDFPPPDNGHRTWIVYPLRKRVSEPVAPVDPRDRPPRRSAGRVR